MWGKIFLSIKHTFYYPNKAHKLSDSGVPALKTIPRSQQERLCTFLFESPLDIAGTEWGTLSIGALIPEVSS